MQCYWNGLLSLVSCYGNNFNLTFDIFLRHKGNWLDKLIGSLTSSYALMVGKTCSFSKIIPVTQSYLVSNPCETDYSAYTMFSPTTHKCNIDITRHIPLSWEFIFFFQKENPNFYTSKSYMCYIYIMLLGFIVLLFCEHFE